MVLVEGGEVVDDGGEEGEFAKGRLGGLTEKGIAQ